MENKNFKISKIGWVDDCRIKNKDAGDGRAKEKRGA